MNRPLSALAALALAAAPAAAQAPLPVDLTARATGADSFAVRVQGREVGHQRTTFEAATGGWHYTETTVLAGRLEQTTTVTFGRDGSLVSVSQRGTGRGQPMATDLAYAGGRVRGRSSNPGPDGAIKAFEIDSAVGIVVDDNALQALMPALPLAEGASWRLVMFSAGRNQLVPMTLTVTGRAEVEVPAGRFDAWRVEAAGAESVIAFAVSAAAPRRVLRVEIVGSPLEFVLVQ